MTYNTQPPLESVSILNENEAHAKFVSQLCVGLQLAVIRAASVTTHKATMLIFDGIVAWNVWVYDSPHVWVGVKRCGK